MKKTLIALAAVAATGAVMAQSSVTVYGVVDTSVAYVKGQNSVNGMLNNGNATSRLGFKGVEDLGNGLKAEFVLEGAVQPDNGQGATQTTGFNFARQSTVGLTSADFGTVRLGRALTASYNAVSRYDLSGNLGLGSSLNWGSQVGTGTGVPTATGYNNRASNMISYISPKFAGFGVGVDYGFGEQDKNSNARYVGVGATYDNGPLSLGLGYDKQNNNLTGVPTTASTNLQTWGLGGAYNLEVVKLAAFYTESEAKNSVGGVKAGKLKTFGLGASAPVGAAGTVKATYNNYKYSDNATGKANQFSLGYVHALSKRTALYGTYAYLKNKNGGAFQLNGAADLNANIGTKNGKQQGLQVGVKHAF